MKNLTSSVYAFEKLRKGDFLYVDKTEYIWNLIKVPGESYFLSRPRRFGKSLTLSTLKAVFQGKKELFQGLAIYDKPYDWKQYPIIHIDMNGRNFCSVESMENSLRNIIAEQGRFLGVSLEMEDSSTMFHKLIESLSKDSQVVVLIDEYDKPILNNVSAPFVQDVLNHLKSFYSVIKEKEYCIHFAFIAGVTKFCHVSLFSDLNNLTDITMDARYATMLGYTQEELEANFADRIEAVAGNQNLDDFKREIKSWYNGYRFHRNSVTVYNPVSLAKFFESGGEFNNYWFSTGTPTFLFELMKRSSFNFPKGLSSAVSDDLFNSFEIDRIDPLALLYQTGYVTIAECRQKKIEYTNMTTTEYLLKFPNREVEESFNKSLLGNYTGVPEKDALRLIQEFIKSVGSGDVELFIKLLKGVFAGIPYDIHVKNEHYYQTIVYVIFDMLRFYIGAEHQTNDGRIDLMLTAGDWIYVVELKMDQSATTAMKQIENKEYALKFRNRGKRIMAIGINFDSAHGQISDWLKEEIKSE